MMKIGTAVNPIPVDIVVTPIILPKGSTIGLNLASLSGVIPIPTPPVYPIPGLVGTISTNFKVTGYPVPIPVGGGSGNPVPPSIISTLVTTPLPSTFF